MSEVRVHLAREILGDLWRHKLQVVLAIAVLVTAFAVILVTNMTRGLTAKQNDLMAEEDRLNIEWRHLLLEQGTLDNGRHFAKWHAIHINLFRAGKAAARNGLGNLGGNGRCNGSVLVHSASSYGGINRIRFKGTRAIAISALLLQGAPGLGRY